MSASGAPLLASASSSVHSQVIRSVELKLEPMWPGAGLHDHVERVEAAEVGEQLRARDRIASTPRAPRESTSRGT